ncbi:PAS domain-containing protein [Bradyrhizobium diazoefficiens]|nr:PAS domain-containing protein [Bradyrhizobium diazoefficiens]MBR0700757.1 PAS domain-containing protein [Bradyrhizobium diazoefficiens]MBR0769182.1 PAS domain-containing protein [Bradyrhizobium diazoefficiens]
MTSEEVIRRHVIGALRNRQTSLTTALQPLVNEQARMLVSEFGFDAHTVGKILQSQNTVLNVLSERYDALDEAAHYSEIPFVELANDGRIVYSNAAFDKLIPGKRGAPFSGLFGSRAADVYMALRANHNTSLRADIQTGETVRQVRVEIGPLRDEDGKPGNYALLLDQSAEQSRLDALQDGVLRTDLTGKIRFANERAAQVLGFSESELKEMSLSHVFGPDDDGTTNLFAEWFTKQTGFSSFVRLRPKDGRSVLARVSGTPYMEAPNSSAGLLVLFAPLAEDRARHELKTILAGHDDPQEIIEATLQAIGKVIPFEMCTFGVYNDLNDYWRAVTVSPRPSWEWSTRWFKVPSGVIEWLEQGKTWDNDLAGFVESRNPEEKDNPVSKAIIDDKFESMLVLPIRKAGGRFGSSLALLSRKHKYTAADLRTLQNLGVEEILQAANAAMEHAQAHALRKLKDDLNKAPSARAIAELLATGTTKCLGWEYVGVFRVDRLRSRFVLVSEHVKNDRNLLVKAADRKAEYTQELSSGMLGSCLTARDILVVPDISDTERNYGFIQTAPDQRSAMTVPLFVNGKIELILDMESSELNAFRGPDRDAASGLAADCEQIFAARWHEAIEYALMNRIEQAAVIVDAVGTICHMNGAAANIFGQARDKKLSSFGARDEDSVQLAETGIQHRLRVHLAIGDAPRTELTVLANREPLNDDYGHQLWLFTSLADQSRESDWGYLEETVTAVARETRAPLLMADGLLRSAASLLGKPDLMRNCSGLLEQAANHLLRADLTFERLAERLVVQQTPQEAPEQFDVLELLYQEVEGLPVEDREAIHLVDEIAIRRTLLVRGWTKRLSFAFRSALSSLLSLRITPNDKLTVTISERQPHRLSVSMRLPATIADTVAPSAVDPIEQSQHRARQMASIAVEAIRKTVEQHDGTLAELDGTGFEFELPLCAQEAPV